MRIARLTLLAVFLALAAAPAFASADHDTLPLFQRIFSHVKKVIVSIMDVPIIPQP